MFEYDLLHWNTFLLTTLLLHASPGPDMAFIIGQTIKGGKSSGFAAMFGIWSGAACHALFAAFGLSLILATSAVAFSIIKWAGVAYLIYLGIQAIRSTGSSLVGDSGCFDAMPDTTMKSFRQGIIVSLLNPKVAIFFLAFLPQFVVEGAGPISLQLLLHGFLVVILAVVVEPPIILLCDRMAKSFRSSRRVGLWLDRCLGTILISLGIKLAFVER